jgi:exodeoxyribonuclease V alpha subunit
MAATRPANGAPQADFDAWARTVLAAFGAFQLLCAVRSGAHGVEQMNPFVERLLHAQGLVAATGPWYAGRPVMVTRNDHDLGLMNGDVGITLALPHPRAGASNATTLRVAFPSAEAGGVRWALPSRLQSVETAFAMTVHKSQGSEFVHAALLLPECASPVLTRELVYTGITRARHWFTLATTDPGGTLLEDAVVRRVERASGLMA